MAMKNLIILLLLLLIVLPINFCGSCPHIRRKELRTKNVYRNKITRLGHPVEQYNSFDPSLVVQLSWKPRLFLYRGFLSDEECDYLISSAIGKKRNATQGDFSLDGNDEIGRRIEERISAWTFLPEDNSKPLRVLHFGTEGSKQNYSFIGNESTEQVGEPLLATIIIYLSNVSSGGELLFHKSQDIMWSNCGINDFLRPIRGNAILFFNQHLNATPDASSSHARSPILQGDMWCATKFFHLKGVKIGEDLSSQSDGSDCTDEDENCPRWAAIGECQRNSVFMIGSPDYYGTCRRSCNAC